MSRERNKKRGRTNWLGWQLPCYLAAAALLIGVFAAFLTAKTGSLVVSREVEERCQHLLEHNAAWLEDYFDFWQTSLETSKEENRMFARTTAALVDSYESLAALPDWDANFAGDRAGTVWLVSRSGTVLRGGSLPETLTDENRKALLTGDKTIETADEVFHSVQSSLGVVITQIDLSYAADLYNSDLIDNNNVDNGVSFLVNTEGIVITNGGNEWNRMTLQELCDKPEELCDDKGGLVRLVGKSYYTMERALSNGDTLVAAVPQTDMEGVVLADVQLPILLFATAVLAVLVYAFIMRDGKNSGFGPESDWPLPHLAGTYLNRRLLGRVTGVALAGVLFVVGFSWLSMTLTAYAQHNVHAMSYLTGLSKAGSVYRTFDEWEYNEFVYLGDSAVGQFATAVSRQPALAEEKNLSAYADAVSLNKDGGADDTPHSIRCVDARLYDSEGALLAAGKPGTGGARPGLSQAMLKKFNATEDYLGYFDAGRQNFVFATRCDDGSGRIAVLILDAPTKYSDWMDELEEPAFTEAEEEIYHLAVGTEERDMGTNGSAFLIKSRLMPDATRKAELITPVPVAKGFYSDEGELADFEVEALRSSYAGDQIINGNEYYINVMPYRLTVSDTGSEQGDEYWLVYASPESTIGRDRLPVLLRVAILSTLFLLLLAVGTSIHRGDEIIHAKPSLTERATRRTRTMNGHRVNGPGMGWGTTSGWGSKTPEEKFQMALYNLLIVMLLAMLALGVRQGAFRRDSVLRYIISGSWDKELNIFSCTYVVMVMAACFSVSWVVRGLLRLVTANLGPRSETMGRLLSSLVQYAAYLAAGLYLLYKFGINANVLLASAGILTLVLSPTLNMLLGDVSAGIFIVFEDEYRVGDIVSIKGWRGVVLEITLRTTRLEDLMGNVKVFNNSTITEVENLSLEYTTSAITVGVPYEESIDHIEKLLRDELPKMAEEIPTIVGTPTYEGIEEFGDSGVLIRIHAMSREEHRSPMCRRLRHELKAMFDRRGIDIPYTQIVLHDYAEERQQAETARTEKATR